MDYRLDTIWNPNVVCDTDCKCLSHVRIFLKGTISVDIGYPFCYIE